MIDENEIFFPYNCVDVISTALAQIDPKVVVLNRPLAITDADYNASVVPSIWVPDQKSREMAGNYMPEPTSQTYEIAIQGIVKDWDEAKGLRRHAQFARAIRGLLYREPALQVALRSLTSTDASGVTERTQDLVIVDQKFHGNKVNEYTFLSTLRIHVTTQVHS